MIEDFDAYIASLGRLDESDLYADIDDTMEAREINRLEDLPDVKSYIKRTRKRSVPNERRD
jgi:hypothetical protein